MNPLPDVRVTLVSDAGVTPYTGMLPGLVAGHYTADETHLELRLLCRRAGVGFVQARMEGLDLANRRLELAGRPALAFDVLSLNTGSTPARHEVPGATELALPVKPVDAFLREWVRVLDRFRSRGKGPFRVLNVGAGIGGVELLLAVRHRLLAERSRTPVASPPPEFHLVSGTREFPAGQGPRVRHLVARALGQRAVVIHAGVRVTSVEPGCLTCADGTRIGFDLLLWTTHAGPPAWLGGSGLATAEDGFLSVDACLRSTSHPFVFAAGDLATVIPHRRPKSGVFAVRQAAPLAANLRRQLCGEPTRPFHPQRRFLSLISTGDRHAIAARGRIAFAGDWVWRWKDRIDRRWMRQYQPPGLPEMPRPSPAPPAANEAPDSMRCGGCGGKIGPEMLARVLRRLPPPEPRPDVLIGLEAPDDASVLRVPAGRDIVQSVDFLRDFVEDPWLLGRIAANHALGDLFAMGAEPRTAQVIATVPWAGPAQMEEQLFQLLAGAHETLRDHGVALVGGHSAEGAELAIGFAVQGWVAPDQVLRKAGLRVGDALLLTKPLGTGVLLAADARGLARARWMDAAIDSMRRSSAAAACCLARHGARACTDVTGFGLVGHLLEMVDASNVGAALDETAIPEIEGARECLRLGIRSSLHPENRRLAAQLAVGGPDTDVSHLDLLFDPQTAGGLLAGIPAHQSHPCLTELRALGYTAAAIIGTVEPAPAPAGARRPVRFRSGDR